MSLKNTIKKNLLKFTVFSYLYNKVYCRYWTWRRYNVKIQGDKSCNRFEIPRDTCCEDLRIVCRGIDNFVKIGKRCTFKRSNTIYFQGDGNTVIIGDNTIFDGNDLIVCAEGTKCVIGSDCIIASKVHIRTTDQHNIYNQHDERVNPSKNTCVGNHVWLGDSVVVMKGTSIGDGSIIGLGSIVCHDIPNDSVAVGTPARVVKTNVYWKG